MDDTHLFTDITTRNLAKAKEELSRNGDFSLRGLRTLHAKTFQPDSSTSADTAQEIRNYAGLRPARDDWQKPRDLGRYYPPHTTFYSGLEPEDLRNAEIAIQKAHPDAMKHLTSEEKISRLADVYAELDYLHSFNDGNSRINRAFVRELGLASGIQLDFERIDRTEMYVARDKALARLNLARRSEQQLKKMKCPYYLHAHEGLLDSLKQMETHFPGVELKELFMKAAQIQELSSVQPATHTPAQKSTAANIYANSPIAEKLRQALQVENAQTSTNDISTTDPQNKSDYRPG